MAILKPIELLISTLLALQEHALIARAIKIVLVRYWTPTEFFH